MDKTIIISIVSGIITLLTSVVVAIFASRLELRKIQKELEQRYAQSLFDKRIELYPKLFTLLSSFNKFIEYHIQTKEQLLELQHNLDEWNNANAIFLTKTSDRIAYGYRFYLIDLFQRYSGAPIPEEEWKNIRTINIVFEKSLKAEIGVYDTRPAGILEKDTEKVEKIVGDSIERVRNVLHYK